MNESLFHNPSFLAALLGWFAAQSIKFVWNLITRREIDFRYMISTGGMPSAHSASVSALATSVAIRDGFGSTPFAIALVFALIVMFDAQSVRRAAGQQARLLNQIVQELFKEHHLSAHKLAELLGHTRLEVLAGLLLGVAAGIAVHHV
ncbi:MAG TPA: divergent PAP2 family protein [Kiritimatiellia bacterium]|nr:divergent PAP2 family protein [Kiritimatiellia bacterium]HMO99128.1 divergent PAP2 family protein [Kiritimatiellia bacterium]HMP95694.1 divergent PAP2 family protein [Kiritimatiellia bacterium]